jgi:putative transposase
VGGDGLAADSKNARRWKAHLILWDESGVLMAPLVRRSWSPRGRPPVLVQRGRHREKVSVAAGLWLPPTLDRVGLWSRTLVDGYFNGERVAAAVRQMADELGGRVVVVWDGGRNHQGEEVLKLCGERPWRFRFERLPPYAPQLNPVEGVWSWLKWGRLCNLAPRDADHLNTLLTPELSALADDEELLTSFFKASELPPPRKLLS